MHNQCQRITNTITNLSICDSISLIAAKNDDLMISSWIDTIYKLLWF